jgi:ABC-type glycerol-3-phosphate transport system substrate-binding protein
VLKASIPTTLALAVALTLAGCGGGKPQDSTTTATAAAPTPTVPADHPPAKAPDEVEVGQVAKAEGGQTVAEVYEQKATLAGSKVTVRGTVVKLNPGIMGKDWLHVRDGSGAEGTNDLTVTTTSKPLPNVGDLVLIVGTVSLDKDYGMGYQYPVIVEDAAVTVEQP